MALSFVFIGLSLTSSWGNGHATTYRALLAELARHGHRLTFMERDEPWSRDNRDLPSPAFCRVTTYSSLDELDQRGGFAISRADVVIVGSSVPEGRELVDWLFDRRRGGITAFYDVEAPITAAALETDECEYLRRDQVSRFDTYLSSAGGPLLSRLRTEFGAREATPLYGSVDPFQHYPIERSHRWDLGYLGTFAADRQEALERLMFGAALELPGRKFAVAGAKYPEAVRWPDNVVRREHVAPRDHGTFYASQRWALNVTCSAMVGAGYSPSVRLFEAAASGVPIISDIWPGIESLFEPGREIVLADDARDVVNALEHIDDGERRAIASRARARVLSEHTALHRARALEEHLGWLRRLARVRARKNTDAPGEISSGRL